MATTETDFLAFIEAENARATEEAAKQAEKLAAEKKRLEEREARQARLGKLREAVTAAASEKKAVTIDALMEASGYSKPQVQKYLKEWNVPEALISSDGPGRGGFDEANFAAAVLMREAIGMAFNARLATINQRIDRDLKDATPDLYAQMLASAKAQLEDGQMVTELSKMFGITEEETETEKA